MLQAADAYYLKLGQSGKWAVDSITHGRARIGWKSIPLAQINAGKWAVIKTAVQAGAKTPGAGTMDFHALEHFCRSTEDDLWITFHESKLWWGRLKNGPVLEDTTSKYRELVDGWHDHSEKRELLLANQIPGRISQIQGFRATICRVRPKEALLRLLSGERSPEYLAVVEAKNLLVSTVEKAIRGLHWKDFELLVDLVFTQSGWRRVTAVGETMKSVDLELEDPITGDQYQVQVKSTATKATVDKYKAEFSAEAFRKFYFVVHTPAPDLVGSDDDESGVFEVILPERLSQMVVDAGLTAWLLERIS